MLRLIEAGGALPANDWQTLLRAVNPQVASGQVTPDTISPAPFSGHGVSFAIRDYMVVYNPDLIKPEGPPKVLPEGLPRFPCLPMSVNRAPGATCQTHEHKVGAVPAK